MTNGSPAFSILTWGCQMNEDDSDQMASLLERMGYRPTDALREADIVFLNTCSVRAKPEQKVRSKLGELRELKEINPDLIIGVCGCMAQREGEDLRRHAPHVDIVIGTAQIERIPELVSEVLRTRHPLAALDLPRAPGDRAVVPGRTLGAGGRLKSFVTVAYGCDNFCTYCIVPYVRGKERSRPLADIVEEVRRLADSGCREATLLGQNVNSYVSGKQALVGRDSMKIDKLTGCVQAQPAILSLSKDERAIGCSPTLRQAQGGKDKSAAMSQSTATPDYSMGRDLHGLMGQDLQSRPLDFADLLAALNEIGGIERIRFTTNHPKDLSDKLIRAMAELPKLCEHIHLPIQSGDNGVLRRMKRGYTVEHYRERVQTLRAAVPGVAITTDILVGFPGETEEQFENTLRTVEEIRFDSAFMFAFNAIDRTAAAALPHQLPPKVKNERLRRVIELQNKITLEKNSAQVGDVFEVLVEGPSPKDPNRLTGLTRQNKTMNFRGPVELIGELANVRAIEGHLYGFVGEVVGRQS